jgi:hypothetical protein
MLAWLVAGFAVGCGGAHDSTPPRPPRPACIFGAPTPGVISVSLEDVLAEPDRYAGKRIRLRRVFLVNEFEDEGLYASEAEARKPTVRKRAPRCGGPGNGVKMSGLWWSTDHSHDDPADTSKHEATVRCNRVTVSIEGVFDPCEEGHMGVFDGGLGDVSFVRSE